LWLSKNNTEIYSTYKRTLQAYSDYTINRSLITRRESYLKMVNSHYERGFNDGGFRISQYICTKSEYTTGCAAMIISREYRRRGETARRFGADRQWDLILPSNAHPDNMILSTREERERAREGKHQATTPLSGVQFWYPLHIALQLDLRITSLPENSPKTRDECR